MTQRDGLWAQRSASHLLVIEKHLLTDPKAVASSMKVPVTVTTRNYLHEDRRLLRAIYKLSNLFSIRLAEH